MAWLEKENKFRNIFETYSSQAWIKGISFTEHLEMGRKSTYAYITHLYILNNSLPVIYIVGHFPQSLTFQLCFLI